MKNKICNFCGNTEKKEILIEGNQSFICFNCVKSCHDIIQKEILKQQKEILKQHELGFPSQIHKFLDDYVIGQEKAKKVLSVAVFNHYKRLEQDFTDDVEIEKSNILMIGKTGTGKTLLAKTLAKKLNVPFAIGDATTVSSVGYVGEDCENFLLKLIHAANGNISLAEKGIIYIDEIDKIRKTSNNISITKDVSGECVQQSLLKMMEGTISSVPPQGGRKHPEQEFLKVNTTNILFICGGTFVGLDEIIARRIGKKQIGFGVNYKEKEEKHNELMQQVTPEDLVEYGLIPEFVGRLPIIVSLDELNEDDLIKIITEPKNSLIKQYKKLAESSNGSKLEFTSEAIKEIVSLAKKYETGARALRSIFESFMIDILYYLPEKPVGNYVVDENIVKGLNKLFIKNEIN